MFLCPSENSEKLSAECDNYKSTASTTTYHFLQTNVNGLSTKVEEFELLLAEHNPKVAFISETHLSETFIKSHSQINPQCSLPPQNVHGICDAQNREKRKMTASTKTYHFLQTNINGIVSKTEEFEVFLTENNPDVVFISETHLTEDTIPMMKCHGYKPFHYIRKNKKWGGSSILIKNDMISCVVKERTDLYDLRNEEHSNLLPLKLSLMINALYLLISIEHLLRQLFY